MGRNTSSVQVDGVDVQVSSLDKMFYKEAGFTKGHVIDYYIHVSKVLLPHLHNRALTLKRYPDGAGGFFFYEKNCPAHRPKWVDTTSVPKEKGRTNYCVIQDLPSLVWAANLADLELHTFMHTVQDISRPLAMVLDLDPGPGMDILDCAVISMEIRTIMHSLKLNLYAKTSGSKGMQLYLPLHTKVDYETTKAFAHALAIGMEKRQPKRVVSKMAKKLRKNKVFIDWSQNDEHKTTVCVYSLRAKDRPTVSTPVTWNEIKKALSKKDASLLTFEADQTLKRVAKQGDLFMPVLKEKQKLPAISRLEKAIRDVELD